MQTKEMLKQVIDFNKAVCDNAFRSIAPLRQQVEQTLNLYIDQAPCLSDEDKKTAKDWTAMQKKSFEDYQKLIEENFAKLDSFFQEK